MGVKVIISGGLVGTGSMITGEDCVGGRVEHDTNNKLSKRALKANKVILPLFGDIYPPIRSTEVGFGNDRERWEIFAFR